MLPALPKTFGRLTDVFISSLGAITGIENRLNLKAVDKAVVILVDGLGSSNLKQAAGHAPFLNQALGKFGSISCGFPSTTASSITSFSTGVNPQRHGFVGYRVFDRSKNLDLNLLTGWNSSIRGEDFQTLQTVSELATEQGVASYVIGPSEYQGSGFSMATMRSAFYLPGKTIADRVDCAIELLRKPEKSLAYLYVPELDQAAHGYGTQSERWINLLEELDSQVKRFNSNLVRGAGALLTADHGIVDVSHSKHWFLDESPLSELNVELTLVGGDPRVPYLYLADFSQPKLNQAIQALQNWFGDAAWVLSGNELVENFFKDATQRAVDRIPDIAIICRTEIAVYHRGFAKPKSMLMIGQHGSISSKELNVPLLKFGAFA